MHEYWRDTGVQQRRNISIIIQLLYEQIVSRFFVFIKKYTG